MDIVANIIAGLALVFSVLSFIVATRISSKNSIHSLQSRYYEKIFDDYLITTLPKARERISYTNKKLDGAEDLIDELDKMKVAALYFKYNNPEFYIELTNNIDEATKYISDSCNLTNLDQDKQSEITNKTKDYITNIYQIIFKSATGSNNK